MVKKKKSKESNKTLWSWIIIILMVTSVFGVMLGGYASSRQKVKYNDYTFESVNNEWVLKLDGKKMSFHYLPSQIDHLNISEDVVNRMKNTYQFYMTSAPEDRYKQNIAEFEYYFGNFVYENMEKYYAVALNSENDYGIPIITCANATTYIPVLDISSSNTTGVYIQGNCVKIKGDSSSDFIVIKDRLLYAMLGII